MATTTRAKVCVTFCENSNQQSKQLHTRLRLRGSLAGCGGGGSCSAALQQPQVRLRQCGVPFFCFSPCAFFPAVDPSVVPPFGAPPLSCAVQHHLAQRQAAWQRGLSEVQDACHRDGISVSWDRRHAPRAQLGAADSTLDRDSQNAPPAAHPALRSCCA